MRYVSTRGSAPELDFADVLLAGLAEDGGLYMPAHWPAFSPAEWRALRGLPYAELAAKVIAPFVGESIPFDALQAMCRRAYTGFAHPAVVPLVQLDANIFALELFHGPTLAFKDLALQLAGHLFEYVLARREQRVRIVGATSGDTGSAAIEAMAGRRNIDIAILHPAGKTSEVQRRQMTTVRAGNVLNIAVEGNFDDCQDLVKAMFADAPFRREMGLSAVNSINWAPPWRWARRTARSRFPCPPAISAMCWRPGSPGRWACRCRNSSWPAIATIFCTAFSAATI
jgi:threonine synthase